MKLCLAVSLTGAALAAGSGAALATAPDARGGHAIVVVPRTTKAPPLPKQERGLILRSDSGPTGFSLHVGAKPQNGLAGS